MESLTEGKPQVIDLQSRLHYLLLAMTLVRTARLTASCGDAVKGLLQTHPFLVPTKNVAAERRAELLDSGASAPGRVFGGTAAAVPKPSCVRCAACRRNASHGITFRLGALNTLRAPSSRSSGNSKLQRLQAAPLAAGTLVCLRLHAPPQTAQQAQTGCQMPAAQHHRR